MSNNKKYRNSKQKIIRQSNKTLVREKERMSRIVCGHCGCKEFSIYKLVTNVGAYCSGCGKYIKFLNKEERNKLGV